MDSGAATARRARAVELRTTGWSVTDIATEIGVAKSTAWRWVKHLPLDLDSERAQRKRAHSKLMSEARWAGMRRERDDRRAELNATAAESVGLLSAREILLLGAVVYWCEGSKAKPWREQDCYLQFTNSDPVLIEIFLRFCQQMGVDRHALSYRVSIHESAESAVAERWWADRLGLDVERFHRTTLKRHRPGTNRHNLGEHYRGCLVVRVPRSREIYWRIEGIMAGLADPRAEPSPAG